MIDTKNSFSRQDGGSIRRLRPASGSVAVLVLLLVSTVKAEPDPRFSVSVGAFFADRDSQTQVDGGNGSGTGVDLESDLGLDKSDTVFRVDGYWRFAEKHRIDISGFDLSRTATKQIDTEIIWGDTIYPVNTELDAKMDLTIYKAAYTWEFLKRGRSFLGVTMGLYVMDFGATLSADNLGSRESDDLTAPLPVFGFRGEYRFADRWSLRGSGEVFVIEYGDFDGSLYDLYAGIDYSITDTIAVGVGINSVKFDIGITKDRFQGNLDWEYDGALAYLKFDF
ncbi:MAG TPA: hypothetical protein PKK10_05875 [Woeseiaceae bacterium]|nr:hypothetical protein [Woeseiaceae bacterium]